jgi:hypothetical protein
VERAGRVASYEAVALLLALIHRSAWKGYSQNFRFTEFSEVRPLLSTQRTFDHLVSATPTEG